MSLNKQKRPRSCSLNIRKMPPELRKRFRIWCQGRGYDMQDAIRAEILTEKDLPRDCLEVFGEPGSEWVKRMIRAVIDESR